MVIRSEESSFTSVDDLMSLKVVEIVEGAPTLFTCVHLVLFLGNLQIRGSISGKWADSDPSIIPYKGANRRITSIYGIITGSLSDDFVCSRCSKISETIPFIQCVYNLISGDGLLSHTVI